ncbi:cholecystokinin receptor type A-like [Saccostrea echinata]|uniref:cholecystokinin receptor type A-like n=1 Tax=Saccostrea echinata TaxID=191078 RepID=UPI002A82299A|nr:cholecystokinin receptor type A-like [Saccostrea echinata]
MNKMSNMSEVSDDGEAIQDTLEHLGDDEYAAVVMLIVFSVIGVAGNALVLYGFFMLKPKMTSTIFILTLAGIDFTSCLVTIPATAAMELVVFRVPYDPLCKAYHFLVTTTIPFSAFVMVAIAVDRYYCICKPFIQIMTKFRAKIIVFSLSILALIIGFVSCLNFGLVEQRTHKNETNMTLELQATIELLGPDDPVVLALKEKYFPSPVFLCGNPRMLGETFYTVYNTIYASIYATCGIVVIILYVVIYHFILTRRQRRLRTESFPCCTFSKTQLGESEHTDFIYVSQETQNTCVTDEAEKDANLNSPMLKPNNELQGSQATTLNNEPPPKSRQKKKKNHRKSDATSTFRLKQERIRVNNIKTALMLSVVALVFIAAFLPAWLMKLKVVPFNTILFYMYFIYNVANPFIYAFMNPDFRQKMAIVGTRIKNQFKK